MYGASASDIQKKAGQIQKGMLTMATAGAAAVGAFGIASIKTGAEFDSAMSQVAATLGTTVDNVGELRDKAREMGAATKFSAAEAADGLNILAMSGYDANQSMDMIEDVLHLAAAGSMDLASAASYVSASMKGFNDASKDSAYYADLMAKGATLANTNVVQFGEAMSDGAAVAASYGQTAESMTLSLLRLAEQNVTGTAASTALAAAMKNLYAPTDQAKKIMEELGVSAFDATSGKARDFNDVVNELQESMAGMTDEQRTAYAQTIFGIQGFDAYNKMVQTSTDKQNEWAEALAGATGEAARQYGTMTDNLQGDIDTLKSAFSEFQLGISETLMPVARQVVQWATDVISNFDKIAPAVIGAAVAFGTFAVAINIGNIIKSVTTAFAAFNAILMANPIALVVSAIAGLVAALVYLWNNNEQFRAKVTAAWESVKSVALSLRDGIVGAWNAVVAKWNEVVQAAEQLKQNIVSKFNEIKSTITSIVSSAKTWGRNLIQGFWQGIASAASAVVQKVKGFVSQIKAAFTGAGGFDTHSPSKWAHKIGEFVTQGLAEGIEDKRSDAEKAAEQLASTVYNKLTSWADKTIKHNKLSLAEQISMWEAIQAQYQKGSEQYADAEDKLFDLREKRLAEMEAAEKKYVDSVKEIYKTIDDLERDYQDKFNDRVKEIANSYGLFDAVKEREEVNGQDLINNLRDQINTIDEYYTGLKELERRGGTAAFPLVEELQKMGVGAIDQLNALLALSDDKLTEYTDLYWEKYELANQLAEEQLSGLRKITDEQIQANMDELSSIIGQAVADSGDWGHDLMWNFIVGMQSMEGALYSTTQRVADTVSGIWSGSTGGRFTADSVVSKKMDREYSKQMQNITINIDGTGQNAEQIGRELYKMMKRKGAAI